MVKMRKRPRASIPILIYLLTFIGWLIFGAYTLSSDRRAEADGHMPRIVADQSDFALVNVLKSNDKLVCISTDPQMWWYNYDSIEVRTLTMTASYSKEPLEICLFYLKKGQDDFRLDQRVYPEKIDNGIYTFTLPVAEVTRLRLDVCSDTCVIRDFSVTLNDPQESWRYFVPSNWYMFLMLVLPGLLSSAISLLHNNIVLYLRHGGPLSAQENLSAVDQEDDDIRLDALESEDTAEGEDASEATPATEAPAAVDEAAEKNNAPSADEDMKTDTPETAEDNPEQAGESKPEPPEQDSEVYGYE